MSVPLAAATAQQLAESDIEAAMVAVTDSLSAFVARNGNGGEVQLMIDRVALRVVSSCSPVEHHPPVRTSLR
jgi:hypothetical protein